MDTTPQQLAELARAYILRRFGPVAGPICLHIYLGPDLELESILPVMVASRPADAAARAESNIPEVKVNILEALQQAGGFIATGAKLAEASGYRFAGRFRAALREMVDDGQVISRRPGYSLSATHVDS